MASERDIIAYKTGAWTDPRMVDWYARRVSENVGGNRLVNRVETGLIAAHVRGREVLDVGIGTGRASLPLLEAGLVLTGIDSSQAMLDECRRRAGSHPIRLELGDVSAIPFANASFDSLVSLNVLTHFPNWRALLSEWLRVVRPGGRLVFDVYSLDHIDAVAKGHDMETSEVLGGLWGDDPSRYNLRLGIADLANFAGERGITLAGIHPYSGTVGGDQNLWLERGWAHGRVWERMKSWIAEDDRLFEFLVFLETELFVHLNTQVSGRYMVVLEKSPDDGRTAHQLQRQAAVAALPDLLSMDDLAPFLALAPQTWRERCNGYLAHPRNRLVLFQLLTALKEAGKTLDLADWFDPAHAALLDHWQLAYDLDQRIYSLASGWHQGAPYVEALTYKGVPLGPGLEYETVRAMMRVALASHAEEAGHE
ncbi:MAG TPA: class I SAM-dependent methyltransferase [Thiobacillaceae bacterium]|nr:class I SAM-dependent methyltransferase [Thiobacillaceae bacterium]HNU65126.1 class I SAM-dependent methyltransferase [Thiobacillaceae bacterium]